MPRAVRARTPGSNLNRQHLPAHVAVIMDGNGRWAQRRGLPRREGHRAGMRTVRAVIEACGDWGIPYLTLYAFSTENWKRPPAEVNFLMRLLVEYVKRELAELHRQGVRLTMLGERERIPTPVLREIDQAVAATRANTGVRLNLAFNYGGRREILEAVKSCLAHPPAEPLTEEVFSRRLYTADMPDPDLLIRTSGEFRLSNFLLWQLAYAEIMVTPTLWPDFGKAEFARILRAYQKRQRRFGGVEAVHA